MLGHRVRNQVMIIILCISDIMVIQKTIPFEFKPTFVDRHPTDRPPETQPKKHSTVLTILFSLLIQDLWLYSKGSPI